MVLAAAGGGNCANVCESGMTHYRTCIAQTMCTDVATSTACTDDDDATREPPRAPSARPTRRPCVAPPSESPVKWRGGLGMAPCRWW